MTPFKKERDQALSHWQRVCARNFSRAANFREDPVETLFHVGIREAQFDEAVSFDFTSAFVVSDDSFRVMPAVEFDSQAEIEAAEIGDEAGNRDLPAKLDPIAATATQSRPQNFLGRGSVRTQISGKFLQCAGHDVEFPATPLKAQPLTPVLRTDPLPLGEGARERNR